VVTWYGPGYYEQPLYCSRSYTQGTPPWIAIDVEKFGQGWECGDTVVVFFESGETLTLLVLDAGPFSHYYIEDFGPHTPIVGDIPEPFWPLSKNTFSAAATIINRSLQARQWIEMEIGE
jgi:hypothetical protein